MAKKSKKKTAPRERMNETSVYEIETLVSGTLVGLGTASWDSPYDPEFRVSSLPFCPLLFAVDPIQEKTNYRSEFYFRHGTTEHELIQKAMAHSVNAGSVFGHWTCACQKGQFDPQPQHEWCVKPENAKCSSCGQTDAWEYAEVTVKYKGLEGHVDMILRYPDHSHSKKTSKLLKGGEGWKFVLLDYKCVVGSTLINTSEGFVRIDELGFKEGEHPFRTIIDTPTGRQQVTKSFKRKATTRKLTTANGFSLEGTEIHPVQVIRPDLTLEWVQLKNLKEGDWILATTGQNAPAWGNSPLDKNLATVMGFLTANGSKTLTSKGRGDLYFHSGDEDVVRKLEKAHVALCGEGFKKIYHSKDRVSTYVMSDKVRDLLWDAGYVGGIASEKTIPQVVRRSNEEVMKTFLSAYMACDSGSTNKDAIALSSASSELIDQMHVLLWHAYGILGRKYSVFTKASQSSKEKNKNYFYIEIGGPDRARFLEEFPGAKVSINYGKQIQASLEDRSASLRSMSKESRRFIPYAAKSWKTLIQTSGVKGMWQFGHSYANHVPVHVARDFLFDKNSEAYSLDPSFAERYNTLVEGEYHFEQVVSVTSSKRKVWVYDVCVPKGHAFTSNGLVSHNTTNIPDEYDRKGPKWEAKLKEKYPVPANVLQISAYNFVLRETVGLNVAGWALAYIDRSGPVSSRKHFHIHAGQWTKADTSLWRQRLDAATGCVGGARKAREAVRAGKAPKAPIIAPLVKSRPCRTKQQHDGYMAARFYYDGGACPFAKQCCGDKDDSKLTKLFVKGMSDVARENKEKLEAAKARQ